MHTAAALDQEGPCWAEVLNKDLNQNILALALYFFYDTEHRKTFQIFFAGDWQHALIQFCYLCWIYIPSLRFLCLHKLFSSHSAIKSDKTLTTQKEDRYSEQSLFLILSWTPVHISEIHTLSWRDHQSLPFLPFFLLFVCNGVNVYRKERISRINTFFNESKENIEIILLNTQYASAVSVSKADWILWQGKSK